VADQKVRILLVDDHMIVRKGLACIINAQDDMEIISEASDGQDAIEQARQYRPQVVIMDVRMPILDGIKATRIIRSDSPKTQIIGLSMCAREEEGEEMRKAGAIDYLSKNGPTDAILAAIRRAAAQSQARELV